MQLQNKLNKYILSPFCIVFLYYLKGKYGLRKQGHEKQSLVLNRVAK